MHYKDAKMLLWDHDISCVVRFNVARKPIAIDIWVTTLSTYLPFATINDNGCIDEEASKTLDLLPDTRKG